MQNCGPRITDDRFGAIVLNERAMSSLAATISRSGPFQTPYEEKR